MTTTMWDDDPVGYLEELLRRAKEAAAFVDLKRAELGQGSSLAHQSYLESEKELTDALLQLGGQCITVAMDAEEGKIRRTHRVVRLLSEANHLLWP